MSIKTLNNFKKVAQILKKFEERTAPKTFESGNIRIPHWYKLNLYSDGSGYVEDSNKKDIIFYFEDVGELYSKLTKK